MKNLVLFSSKFCGYCPEVKEKLRSEGIKFKEISVDKPEGNKIADKLGIEYVPTLAIKTNGSYKIIDFSKVVSEKRKG